MLVRVLGVVGRLLLGAGILLLLFTAYQLWGTGLVEAHSQARLRAELAPSLAPGARSEARRLGATGGGSTGPPAVAPPRSAPSLGRPVGMLDIPRIGLDQVIVEGVGAPQLRTGPGHYPGTPLPGQAGNAAVAGHRTTYAHPFYDLDKLTRGQRIVVTTPQGIFVYAVRRSLVVAPTDVGVLDPGATPELTLTTCNPRYSAATRLVVQATLVRSLLFAHVPPPPPAPEGPGGGGGAGWPGRAAGAGRRRRPGAWAPPLWAW